MIIDQSLAESWAAVAQPGAEETEKLFSEYLAGAGAKRRILNCAIPLARARELTRFSLPSGVTVRDYLVSTVTVVWRRLSTSLRPMRA
jgi:hypothetical protein